jgi:hypothetical protein
MRRRKHEPEPGTELTDPTRWPQCERFDGGTQPCVCWLSGHVQAEGLDIDMWPLLDEHKCAKPFRYEDI